MCLSGGAGGADGVTTALLLCDSAVIRHVSSVWEFINGAALRLILIKAVSGPMSSLGHFIQNTVSEDIGLTSAMLERGTRERREK